MAGELPPDAWKTLVRRAKHAVKTRPRKRPENVKQQVVEAREFEDIRLVKEHVAEFRYRPVKCKRDYRVVVVWKELDVYQGQKKLFDDARCFFYITNDEEKSAEEIVFDANDRCNQENLLAQLKGGVRSLTAPVDSLLSNWAYMVMGVVGLEPEGLGRAGVAGEGPLAGSASGGETEVVADGLQHVPRRDDEDSGADPLGGPEDCVSVVGVESVAACLLPSVRSASPAVALLRAATLKPESGCSGPLSPLNRTECNRVRHETRTQPETSLRPPQRRPLTVSSDIPTQNNHPERLRRSLV